MANAALARPSAQAGPSKSRRTILVDEDASKLEFGEFKGEGIESLTPTDVQTLLTASRIPENVPPFPDNKVYKLTSEYINEFTNASQEVVESMRTALSATDIGLNKFEKAQIMILRPGSVEEAVALIPSLDRYSSQSADESDKKLEDLLNEIRRMARYGAR